MPIKDKWYVFWGGTNEFLNYHYPFENQRYAYDLVVIENGLTFTKEENKNENFFAFNKEILAPLDGRVIKVINDVLDNAQGVVKENEPLGNYIVIEHKNNEYSLIAHFKQFSIDVTVCQIKCNTSSVKTSYAVFQLRHFRGLPLIQASA